MPAPAPTPAAAPPETGNDDKAEALYDYDAQEENEISFQEGETIYEIEQVDENWWRGRTVDGSTGLFPANYVQLL